MSLNTSEGRILIIELNISSNKVAQPQPKYRIPELA